MNNLKERFESKELKIYRRLNVRSTLSDKDLNYLLYLEKGFEGEKGFDKLTSGLSDNWLFLNDLLFEINKSETQIDSLGLTGDTFYLFEVKNFEGDYFIENGNWYKFPKIDINNPYDQLKRAESKLSKLFRENNINYKIEPYLIFVNPEFYLYNAPMNLPIIFPNHLRRFMNYLNNKQTNINANHIKLAERLLSLNLPESKYAQYPTYHYEQFRKGITCFLCDSFINNVKIGKVVCENCGFEESISNAILRHIEELKFLFPERKITTNAVYEWCQVYNYKKGISLILRKHFKVMGHGKYSYFV